MLQKKSLPRAVKKGQAHTAGNETDDEDDIPLAELAKALKEADKKNKKNNDTSGYTCQVCKKKFTQKSNLHRHKYLHAKKKLHCSNCDYETTSPYHMKEHTDKCVDGKKFGCTQCGKKYAHRMQVYRHVQSEHK